MDLEKLKAELQGELIRTGDPAYDDARKLHNGMVDRKPRAIARCLSVADVAVCVRFARKYSVLLAIRGGGHNTAGLGSCDDGLVIDLSLMREVRVDPITRTVEVQGGSIWRDVDCATHEFGFAVPNGIISTTGVGGLTLGGGLGHLARKYGLTIDSLLSVDMVLADGAFVTVNDRQREDLFWAVRGGGGNFGVVTSFTFRLHPVHTVCAGPMFWPLEGSSEILERYQDFILRAPEDINGFFAFLKVVPSPAVPETLHLQTVCGVMWCYTGPVNRLEEVLAPVRQWPKPVFEGLRIMPLPVLQSMFDAHRPPGHQWYLKTDFFDYFTGESIQAHSKHGARLPTQLSTMHLYAMNGAIHRVGESETAFAHRKVNFAETIAGVDPDPRNTEEILRWTTEYWEALHPYSTGEAYVNFIGDEGAIHAATGYGRNYDRLRVIKTKYDPENIFRVNHNVLPHT